MRDSAKALPVRLIGVREGMGSELLPTVLFSLGSLTTKVHQPAPVIVLIVLLTLTASAHAM